MIILAPRLRGQPRARRLRRAEPTQAASHRRGAIAHSEGCDLRSPANRESVKGFPKHRGGYNSSGGLPQAFGHFIGPLFTLIISPASSTFITTQRVDLEFIVDAPGLSVTGGTATLDDVDILASLGSCIIPGTLLSGGQTFRCPNLTGDFLGEGTHTLSVTLDLSDGSSVSDNVTWEVVGNTEP